MALLFAQCVNFKVFAEEYGVGKELARWEGGGLSRKLQPWQYIEKYL